jgi:hypothetical protein
MANIKNSVMKGIWQKKRPLWKQGPKPKLTAYEKNLIATLNILKTIKELKSVRFNC